MSSQPNDWNKEYVVESPEAGDEVWFHFEYYWMASGTCPDHEVEIRLDESVYCAGIVSGVPGGYTVTVCCVSSWLAAAGDHVLTGETDTNNNVSEWNESNNEIDYEFTVEGNNPPNAPSDPNPPNGATNIDINADLSWNCSDPDPGDTVTYDVYFGISSTPPKVESNQSETVYDPGVMEYGTLYYWMIVAWDNHGASTAGQIWSFTTEANNPPVFGAPNPANGSTGNPLSFTWSIPMNDPEGDLFSWTIECSNGQGSGANNETNGTKALALSGLLYSTTYIVWVNATDPAGSNNYTREWFTFTTEEEQKPKTKK